MAEFTDRIKLVFDAVTQDATSGVGKLKSGVGEAEGAFGKLKAGAGGALDLIGQNAVLSTSAAGLAIGKFVMDAIGHFQKLALEANNFGDAVGLSVEDASRWIEVAGDLGVNVDALQGAVGKLNIATANGVLDKLGVGGDTTNERLLNALQHLQAMPNAADRAKEGMQLFGKSWTDLAPLVETAGDLREKLAAVNDAKVINEAEVQKAKDLRDAMDRLSDVWDDFVLSIGGGAIGIVADFADGLGNLAEQAETVADATGGLVDIADGLSFLNPISQLSRLGSAFSDATDSSKSFADRARNVGADMASGIPVIGGWASGLFGADDAQQDAQQSAADLAESQKAAAQAAQAQADATKEAEDALRKLNDAQLAAFSSDLGLADAADRTTDAIAKYQEKNDAAAQSSFGSAAANDEARRSMNDAEQAALAQAAAAAKLDSDQKTAAGSSQTLAEKNAIMAGTLQTIAGTLAPDSPLRKQLLDYATTIEGLPTDATTTFHADTEEATKKINALITLVHGLATDFFGTIGAIGRGQAGVSGTAITAPSSASSGVSALSASSAVGLASPIAAPRGLAPSAGVVINNYVSVAPFTSPAEVGRSIADYLDAFYRRSGTRARAVA